jgi:hypothetical protein
MALCVVAGWFASPTIESVAPGTCPSAVSVQTELAALLPSRRDDDHAASGAHTVRLTESDGNVRVTLMDGGGGVLAMRELPATRSCEELAVAAAVVVATWASQLDSVGPLSVGAVGLAPPRPATTAVASSPMASAPPPSFAVGLGLVTSVAGGTVAPGARLEGRLAPFAARLGLAVSLTAVAERTVSVGEHPGAADWARGTLAAGPEYRWGDRPRTLDLHLLALVAALRVSGVALPQTRSETTGQLGIAAGARAGWSWGTGMAWLGADALVFPGRDALAIEGLTAMGTLPHLELQLAAGMSLGRFR